MGVWGSGDRLWVGAKRGVTRGCWSAIISLGKRRKTWVPRWLRNKSRRDQIRCTLSIYPESVHHF